MLASAALDDKTREEIDELTHMLKGNLEKVVQHGKRADSIVKNMLLHSREGSGEHRPADINAIVEESLNLAYHGARAEKSGFNITLKRELDPAAGMIDLYPQEITRVFLNLISNGFYAATKRKEVGEAGFEPTLSATTKNLGNKVEIRIRDNGTGIPREVKEKMFNPFFTTKPAGEGTGLGLSMSHDIVVKQHGGKIDVDTEPGAFTEFIITLPRTAAAQVTGRRHKLSVYILVVDDEPDVEALFRQQFRRDLRSGRFTMEFAPSAPAALARAAEIRDPSLILILSDINMPGMSGLEMLPKVRAERPDVPVIMITAYGDAETRRKAIERGAVGLVDQADRFRAAAPRDRYQARAGRMTATILVVDDEPDLEALVLQKFRRQIRDGAVTFVFAHDGIEALQSIEQHPHVDMVVSDINMPRMDGLSLLHEAAGGRGQEIDHHRLRLWRHEQYPHRDESRRVRFPDQADRFRRSRNDHRQDHPSRRDDARGAPPPSRGRARACVAVALFLAADRAPARCRRRERRHGGALARGRDHLHRHHQLHLAGGRPRRRKCWARCSTNMSAA